MISAKPCGLGKLVHLIAGFEVLWTSRQSLFHEHSAALSNNTIKGEPLIPRRRGHSDQRRSSVGFQNVGGKNCWASSRMDVSSGSGTPVFGRVEARISAKLNIP